MVLLIRNIKALTAILDVKFIQDIPIGTEVTISAKTVNARKNVFHTIAIVRINDEIYAEGKGKFLRV